MPLASAARAISEGEEGSAGLNPSGTGFTSPTAHSMPVTPDFYQELMPPGYPGAIGRRILCPMPLDPEVDQSMSADRSFWGESLAKTREGRIFLEWFLEMNVPDSNESGWEWIARHAMERRTARMRKNGRLFWPAPTCAPSVAVTPTIPLIIHHSPKAIHLGTFAKNHNWLRRCRKVIVERHLVTNKTHSTWVARESNRRPVANAASEGPELGPSPVGLPRVLGPPRASADSQLETNDYPWIVAGAGSTLQERHAAAWVRLFVSFASGRMSLTNQGVDIEAVDYDLLGPRRPTGGELATAGLSIAAGSSCHSPFAHIAAGMFLNVWCIFFGRRDEETILGNLPIRTPLQPHGYPHISTQPVAQDHQSKFTPAEKLSLPSTMDLPNIVDTASSTAPTPGADDSSQAHIGGAPNYTRPAWNQKRLTSIASSAGGNPAAPDTRSWEAASESPKSRGNSAISIADDPNSADSIARVFGLHARDYEVDESNELSDVSSQGCDEVSMAERGEVCKWRTDNFLADDLDFAYVFSSFAQAYLNAGKAVAKHWSKSRILANPAVFSDESRFSKIEGTTKKIQALDEQQEHAIVSNGLSDKPPLRQPEKGAGCNEAYENSRIFAEPLEQLLARCTLRKSDTTLASIESKVEKLINATSVITLYRAAATAVELQEYLSKCDIQLERDELDAKTIEKFLLATRAQRRAGNSVVWMSNNLQLGWPVTELEETMGARTTHSYDYICFGWLRPPGYDRKPLLALWHAPPKTFHERRSLVAQPGMFRRMEDAMETGAENSTPTWLAYLAVWLQALSGRHLKHILRGSIPVKRNEGWMTFFCRLGSTRHAQPGFYWKAPTVTTSGYNWTEAFLRSYALKRYSSRGKSRMGMIFRTDNFAYLSSNMVNAITMCEVRKVVRGPDTHRAFSWRRILPTVSCLLNQAPDATQYGSIVRFGEATANLRDADREQLDTLNKQICAAALNMLARDGIYSFGEVPRQEWESRARDAAESTRSDRTKHKPQWLNPDVAGSLGIFHERSHSAAPGRPHLSTQRINTCSFEAEINPIDIAGSENSTFFPREVDFERGQHHDGDLCANPPLHGDSQDPRREPHYDVWHGGHTAWAYGITSRGTGKHGYVCNIYKYLSDNPCGSKKGLVHEANHEAEQASAAPPRSTDGRAFTSLVAHRVTELTLTLNNHGEECRDFLLDICSDHRLKSAGRYDPSIGQGVEDEMDPGNFAGSILLLAMIKPHSCGMPDAPVLDILGTPPPENLTVLAGGPPRAQARGPTTDAPMPSKPC